MKRIYFWTPAIDAEIKARRFRRESWAVIAKALNKNPRSLIERGRKIGAHRGQPPLPPIKEERDRLPLDAGSAVTWGAINAGLETRLGPYVASEMQSLLPECRWAMDVERVANLTPEEITAEWKSGSWAAPTFPCDAPRLPNRPYCLCHAKLAYPLNRFAEFTGTSFDRARAVERPAAMLAA